jgi:hypothetical protein
MRSEGWSTFSIGFVDPPSLRTVTGAIAGFSLPPYAQPHFCPCEAWFFTTTLLNPGPFRLANGQLFDPNTTITLILEPLPGRTYLQDGQTFSIVLTSVRSPVPEPGTWLLFASGLLGLAGVARGKWAG